MSITVYSKPACVQCTATTRSLDAKGVAYTVVDLTEDDDLSSPGASAEILEARIDAPGIRLDKALADAFPTLSRARLQALLAEGAVTRDGEVLTGGSAKAQLGLYAVALPPVAPATPQPQA